MFTFQGMWNAFGKTLWQINQTICKLILLYLFCLFYSLIYVFYCFCNTNLDYSSNWTVFVLSSQGIWFNTPVFPYTCKIWILSVNRNLTYDLLHNSAWLGEVYGVLHCTYHPIILSTNKGMQSFPYKYWFYDCSLNLPLCVPAIVNCKYFSQTYAIVWRMISSLVNWNF